jgi:hypothetical protein
MAAHAAHDAPLAACPNCDTPFDATATAPAYCPHCGQRTLLHPPSVAEFAHEFVGHYVALEGALWSTVRLLLLHPGRLTREYLAGRRSRFVLPLRLYLSTSFVFFLALKLGGGLEPALSPEAEHGAPAAAGAPARGGAVVIVNGVPRRVSAEEMRRLTEENLKTCEEPASSAVCGFVERTMDRAAERWFSDPQARADFVPHALGVAPYAAFLMLPVFAGLFALAYRSRRMLFGEHVVFALHLHAFVFLAATLSVFLPSSLVGVVEIFGLVYAARALHTVYRGGWAGTIARLVVLMLAYGILLTLVTSAISIWLIVH